MRPELTPLEARVIGCLIEKEITTPDQYPLTLNALTAACNQRSNRSPVLELSDLDVQGAVDGLMRKHLVTDRSPGFGGRVTRYRHRFCNTQFGDLRLAPVELAIVCELLLRGPQTPGELRGRASRMAAVQDVAAVESALQALADREEPLVERLPREAGKRESRWQELFSSTAAAGAADARAVPVPGEPENADASVIELLEARLDALEQEIDALRRRLDGLAAGGD